MTVTYWALAVLVDDELSSSIHRSRKGAEDTIRSLFDHIPSAAGLTGDELVNAVEAAYTPKGYCRIEISECPVLP
jgi:hypothetical protein